MLYLIKEEEEESGHALLARGLQLESSYVKMEFANVDITLRSPPVVRKEFPYCTEMPLEAAKGYLGPSSHTSSATE